MSMPLITDSLADSQTFRLGSVRRPAGLGSMDRTSVTTVQLPIGIKKRTLAQLMEMECVKLQASQPIPINKDIPAVLHNIARIHGNGLLNFADASLIRP
jgi:hypothetical protein